MANRIKVVVHTKSGRRLAYWAATEKTAEDIDEQWGNAIKRGGAVTFDIYTMNVDNIDYVEVSP